jgi:hypothetical protein
LVQTEVLERSIPLEKTGPTREPFKWEQFLILSSSTRSWVVGGSIH